VSESDPTWPAAWDSAANGAEQAWNNVGTSFHFNTDNGGGNRLSTTNQGNTGTLATSSWSYNGAGVITQASTIVNTYYQFNPPNPSAPGTSGTYDLQSVLTHELGHWLSLGHSTSANNDGSRPVMYYSFAPGEVRRVGSDDAAGLQAIYGPAVEASATPTATKSPTSTPTSTSSSPTPTPTNTATVAPTQTSTPIPSGPTPTATPDRRCVLALRFHVNLRGCPSPATTRNSPATVTAFALIAQTADSLSQDPAVSKIVIGKIREVKASQQSGGTVYTDAVVDVNEHLLSGAEKQLTVRNPGGSAGGKTTIVEDAPELKPGETVLLFLTQEGHLVPLEQGTYTVRGFVQGAYHLNGNQAVSELAGRSQDLPSLRNVIQSGRRRR
jgi:hypothetical protein